ncbi:MAG: hypothetical protein P4L50_10105 [Anaerolineaceae bacterium]|nr:hypothetical protein [Anaerolineaceae bacterium]
MKQLFSFVIIGGILVGGCTSAGLQENHSPTPQLSPNPTALILSSTETVPPAATTIEPSVVFNSPVPTQYLSQPSQAPTQSGANGMTGNDIYLDKVAVIMQGKNPAQPTLQLQGLLPTPCNKLQIEIGKPDANNQIQVKVYSLTDPDKICAQVLVPFSQSIPIKNLNTGKYTVWVNGKQAGNIEVP